MDEDGIPSYSGLAAYGSDSTSGWGQGYGTSGYTRDADVPPSSQSQVPGTSGAPSYTPSATPGGVSSGSPGGTPAPPSFAPPQTSPWGSLAAMLGLSAPQTAAGATKPGQGMKIAQLGMRMLNPPASPIRQGAPAPTLSTAGQNPQLMQIQRMFGVDAATAQMMMAMMQPGGSAITPQQQSQLAGGLFAPTPTTPALQPGSAMPTAAQPYTGRAAVPIGALLPPLGQGAFAPTMQFPGMPQQGPLPMMQYGGRPTGPTIVGEQGPEIFVPDVPGSIVPMRPQMNDLVYRQRRDQQGDLMMQRGPYVQSSTPLADLVQRLPYVQRY